jgi:Na+/glutamate symporter
MGLTMTSATIGLILGGIIGGPVAERLIRRISSADATISVADGGVVGGPVSTPVTTISFTSRSPLRWPQLLPASRLGACWRVARSPCRHSCGA